MKGTDKGCGGSWDGVIGMKCTGEGCGSCGDGVIGMKGSSKSCGSCGDGVGCRQVDEGYRQKVWFLGCGKKTERLVLGMRD